MRLAEKDSGSPEMEFRTGSFLWLAKKTLGDDFKATLEGQYQKCGTTWMGKHWGYDPAVVRRSLIKLGIPVKSKKNYSADIIRKVNAFGGIDVLVKRYRTVAKIKEIIGCSDTPLIKLLRKKGYRWNYIEKTWTKEES